MCNIISKNTGTKATKHSSTNRHCLHEQVKEKEKNTNMYVHTHTCTHAHTQTWPFCLELLLRFFTLQPVSSAPLPPSLQIHKRWDPADKHAGNALSHLVQKNCVDILEVESQQCLPSSAVGGPENI